MAALAITIIRPHPGKRQAAESRARQAGGIYARHGASVKISNFIAGPYTGCIGLFRAYADFQTAAKAFLAASSDPAYTEFEREREANPLAEIVIGRNIVRSIYGESKWATHPVTQLRQYDIARDKIADALKLFPKVSKVVSKNDVNVIGLLPVVGDDMNTMTVSYQFHSISHWAEAVDVLAASKEFQGIVAEASKLGTLSSASVLVPL
jgi:hypothetical protein